MSTHNKQGVQDIKSALAKKFPTLNQTIGQSHSQPQKLTSCVQEIDDFLDGGIPFDGITEFGMPLGKEGRVLLLKFLVNATQGLTMEPIWTLWVSSHLDFSVFPPAWFAKGISPSRIIFTQSTTPAQDLKRAIINPLFKLIVLDSPHRFSKDDCFFVNTQARFNHQLVLLLRNFFLSNNYGNVWAKLRLNCWKRHATGRFVIKTIRGLPKRQLCISEKLLL